MVGGIRTCLGFFSDPLFLWISSNSCLWNLLLVLHHQAEIIIVKRLIQGRSNVTRVRVEPKSCDQGCRKNDAIFLVKKSRAQQRTIINVPDLVPADALPSFSQAQRTRAEAKEGINVVYDLSPSWDKVLKSDMKVSPGTLTSDVISQSLTSNNDMTSRSLDTSGVTPVKEANCGMEFVKTAAPHISALSLEKTKHADQPIPDICSNSNPFSSQKPSSFTLSSLAKHIPKKQTGSMFTRVKLEPEVSQNPTLVKQGNIPTVANELKEAKKDTPSAMPSKGFLSPATKMTTPQPDSNLDFSFLKHLPPPSLLKNATGKSSTSSVSFPVSTISTASPNSSSDLSSHAFTETTSSSPYCSSTKSTSTTSSNLMRIKEALEKPISLQFSSPTLSEGTFYEHDSFNC